MSPSLWIKQHCNPGNDPKILSVIACHGKQRQLIDWRKPLLQQNTTSWFISLIEITYWTSCHVNVYLPRKASYKVFPYVMQLIPWKAVHTVTRSGMQLWRRTFRPDWRNLPQKLKLFLCNEKYAACVIAMKCEKLSEFLFFYWCYNVTNLNTA